MHVKEISLDGFKSYAQRVIILGFDPQFNAITGLNGSGKSNILDSICFVLGIQNLQQVGAWSRGARQVPAGEVAGGASAAPLRTLPPPAGPGQQPAGAGVQAGPGWHHQGHRFHCV